MDKDYKVEHENKRKELWINTFVAYVQSSNSTRKERGADWADEALKQFDERFKEPME